MTDEATARPRVAAGARVLDGWDPTWRSKLNPGLLDMASGRFLPPHPDDDPGEVRWPASCGCVAAQWCYVQMGHPDSPGTYQDGVMLLAAGHKVYVTDDQFRRWAVDHGLLAETTLDSGFDATAPEAAAEYELLTSLWREELARG